MNKRKKELYKSNVRLIKLFEGARITSATREIYNYDGELDTESMGTLKLVFDNGKTFIFNCDGDSESLAIREGDFSDKSELNKSHPQLKWERRDFVTKDFLDQLLRVKDTKMEWFINHIRIIQSGCKIEFDSGQFLYIWTMDSDSIFYSFNKYPSHYEESESIGMGIFIID